MLHIAVNTIGRSGVPKLHVRDAMRKNLTHDSMPQLVHGSTDHGGGAEPHPRPRADQTGEQSADPMHQKSAQYIVDSLGESQSIRVVPWQTNKILCIVKSPFSLVCLHYITQVSQFPP